MLSLHSVCRSFGGVNAVHDMSFNVAKGAVHAVIGPNGAGKTTLFNLITGIYPATAGDIRLDDVSVTGRRPDELAQRGVSRTFQNMQICMNMTARENVMLGFHLSASTSMIAGMFGITRKEDQRFCDEANELMALVGIGTARNAHASQLSYGVLKRLEIARALASKPRLLLLDEPAAGLNDTETADMTILIRNIAASGITVLLVEHNMKLVMRISDQILVLNHGKKLAEGTAEQVQRNPDVIAAYLGVEA